MKRTVLLTLALLACGKDKPEPPPAAASAPAPIAEKRLEPTLSEQLAKEAATRPTGTPRAEEVLAALAAAGVKVTAPRQFLGATVDASFCFGGRADDGLAMSVCEYSDEAAAQKGRETSLSKFKMVVNREILVNKKTTLTLTSSGPPAADPEVAKAREAFGKL